MFRSMMKRLLLAAMFAWVVALPTTALAMLMPVDGTAGQPATAAATGGGFDWADWAVGLGVGIATTLVVVLGVEYLRHHMPHLHGTA